MSIAGENELALLDDPVLVRALGTLYLIAPLVVVAIVIIGHPPNPVVIVALGLTSGVLGFGFRQNLLPLTHRWIPDLIAGMGTALVSSAIFVADGEAPLFLPFYLWLIPVIYASRPTRRARLHAVSMTIGAAVAIGLHNLLQSQPIALDGQPEAVLTTAATIAVVGLMTEHLVRAVRNRAEDFASAWSYSPAGIALISAEGRFLAVNPAFELIVGRSTAELLGASVDDLSHPDDITLLHDKLRQVVDGECRVTFTKRCQRPRGETIWSEITVSRSSHRGSVAFLALVQDMTPVREAETAIEVAAHHDPLTGLPNRLALLEALDKQAEAGVGGALLIFGVDRFKVINDVLGPANGDRVLVQLADRLARAARSDEFTTRLSGDEFAVLTTSIEDARHATDRAREITEAIRAPYQIAGDTRIITVSVGISMLTPTRDPAVILRDATSALTTAKELGRDRCELFSHASRSERVRRATIEHDLRKALESEEIRAFYQPVHDIATGKLVGFEALARWYHPTRGLLDPAQFISVAEETGLIRELGRQLLKRSCAEAATWRRPSHDLLTLAVNLSPYQLADDALASHVGAALDLAALPATTLTLEVRESALIDVIHDPGPTLRALSDLGVRLALDDFGTGASSLSSLRRFQFDSLKIDRTFVAGLPGDSTSETLVSAAATLGHKFGLTIIAEGVERKEQLEAVRAAGCEQVQGYLFSVPLPPDDVLAYLAKWHHPQGNALITHSD